MANEIIVSLDEKKGTQIFRDLGEKSAREFIAVVKRAYKQNPKKK